MLSCKVTTADAWSFGFTSLTRVTVTLAGLGITSGAVYSPELLTVPKIEFPFATPFTCQITARFPEPVIEP